ncbi:MAG: GNAT family N-acetyltransferase [Clostridiales bacterium]|nr:GNAT family N-acetyltransferase [Clostridiales bacterium]
MIRYETNRLIIKTPEIMDLEKIMAFEMKNIKFLLEFEPRQSEEHYLKESFLERLINDIHNIEEDKSLRFYLYKKNNINQIIGMINFSNIVRGAFQSCFLGYKMDEDFIDNGFMTEGIIKMVGVVFDDFNLHRIEANIMPKNVRSIRVVEKSGFINEGLSKKYLKINGVWEDHFHYVILNEKIEVIYE